MGIWRLIVLMNIFCVCVCVGGWAGLCGRCSGKSVLTEITWMEACPRCVWVGDSSWSSQEPRLGWTQRELAQEGPGGSPLELQLRRCWFICWICHTHGTAWAELWSCSSSGKEGSQVWICLSCPVWVESLSAHGAHGPSPWRKHSHCSENCISHGTAWTAALLIQR